MTDLIILGAGTAGLSAAIYAARASLSVKITESAYYGGQIVNSPEVENYPGIKKTTGFDFAQSLFEHASELGINPDFESVDSVTKENGIIKVRAQDALYEAKSLIIATGAKHRKLGVPGEDKRGVSYCATCDGAFYRGKNVCVVGGGNTALEDALYLSSIASHVTLIHRRQGFRAEKSAIEALEKRDNVSFLLDARVKEICGETAVSSVVVSTPDKEVTLDVLGVFVAVGMVPETDLFRGLVECDEAGYIIAGEDCATSLEGVFAAGDVRTKPLRQLVTAAADGAVAATMAARYIDTLR